MRRFRLFLFLFSLLNFGWLHAQDTLSVDAVATMPVCSPKNPDVKVCASAPKVLSRMNPSYPDEARKQRKEGTVILGATVTREGSVTGIHVVKSVDKDIDRAAVDAVSQWKFDPGQYEGKPVDVELKIEVNFRLQSNASSAPSSENSKSNPNATDEFRNIYANGNEAFNRNDYATAVNLLRRATTLQPQNSNAWNELGRALLAMNEVDAAIHAFQTSIANDPTSRNAYNNLGLAYERQRKYADAEAQFRKQIVVNPDDHYAHRNLGTMLAQLQRCADAMPELEKALSLTPNHVGTLIAQGGCDLDSGNRAKGVSELQQATSISSAPLTFNDAAYALAKRNIELEMAEKWSDHCLTMERARLQGFSLDHLTPEQLNYVFWIAAYWDTRGWIYFLRSDIEHAHKFVESAWSLRVDPTVGDHLGHIDEKLGLLEDARRVYAMSVVAADDPSKAGVDPQDLADAKSRLEKLTGGKTEAALKQAKLDLAAKNTFLVDNPGAISASADYAIRLKEPGKPAEFQQLSADKTLAKINHSLPAAKMPVFLADSGVEIPLRGSLTCHAEEPGCRFVILSPEEAVNLARNEMAASTTTPDLTHDPHLYDNSSMGMRLTLPDEWHLLKEEPGSFSKPHNVMFGKAGSAAMFMLTRERFEGSFDLYQKMIEASLSQRPDYKKSGEEIVKRDTLTGKRWITSFTYQGVLYSATVEMFGVGDNYYRATALAPKEVYDRYAENFESMFRSVQFPMEHLDPKLLDPGK